MNLLTFTSSLWLSAANFVMTLYRQFKLFCSPRCDDATMHIHIILMQLAMIIIFIQILGRKHLTKATHGALGVVMLFVVAMNIPPTLHLAYLMLLRRHWWHCFVQMTSLVVSLIQLAFVVGSGHKIKDWGQAFHENHVWRLVSLFNGAAGSRLFGTAFEFLLGFDADTSYTLGLTTMFALFLLPQVYTIRDRLMKEPCREE